MMRIYTDDEYTAASVGWGSFEMLETTELLKTKATLEGYKYWLAKCDGASLPSLSDIDLMEIYL